MNNNSKLFLFADDVSIIVTHPNPTDFKNDISTVFEHINVWFKVNLITWNFDKKYNIQFTTKNNSFVDIGLG